MKSWTFIMAVSSWLLILFAHYMALIVAPEERTMGDVQRIFYFHVASAWTAMIAFTMVFPASALFLFRRTIFWDDLAEASAEVGMLFCTVVLITGPIWAKPVWGIWWTWDARLTMTAVMWLTYGVYLLLRHQIADENKRSVSAAALGILAFLNIPLVYFSIHWWRTQHPAPVLAGGESSGLDPMMRTTLFIAWISLLFLAGLMIVLRLNLGQYRRKILLYEMTLNAKSNDES